MFVILFDDFNKFGRQINDRYYLDIGNFDWVFLFMEFEDKVFENKEILKVDIYRNSLY